MALSVNLPFLRREPPPPPPDVAAAALRSDRFRLERETDWRRLEDVVTALEKNRFRRISDEDLLELPVLYRKAASSLAVARETSLDAATLDYLEGLVRRAALQVHGPREGFGRWLLRFFGGGWARAVRAIWLDICIALAISVAGTLAGWLLVARDQDWYYSLVPAGFGDTRQPGASREILAKTLEGTPDANGLSIFASYLFSHNAGVAIMAFALGFAFGAPTVLLAVANMATLGAMLWLFFNAGLGIDFAAWLSIHGTTELTAFLLAYAAGLHIGRAMAFPGERSILAAAQDAGHRAALVMAGVVVMLVCAGLLEGFGRQLVDTTPARFGVGGDDAGAVDRLLRVFRAEARVSRQSKADRRVRAMTTPEGIAMPVTLAGRGARAAALALDLAMIVFGFLALIIGLSALGVGLERVGTARRPSPVAEFLYVILILAAFFARYVYFMAFELGPRGATPGKRALGIRVAARGNGDGNGRLTAEAVLARNLLRDAELFVPLIAIVMSMSGQAGIAGYAAGIWLLIFALFPFFNRDALRAGDLVAGTWVIEARRPKLQAAMSIGEDHRAEYQFSEVALSTYGEHELQVLERVLREDRPEALRQVTETICAKFGWTVGAGDEREFLEAFYAALRQRLEGDMRFGKRKLDKFS